MQSQGTTFDPISGKTYRITAPKERSAQFRALEAAVDVAKEAQGLWMRQNRLTFDVAAKVTRAENGTAIIEGHPLYIRLQELLTATRAAQSAVKAYKITHKTEFEPAASARRSVIPTINVPRGRGRGRGRGVPLNEGSGFLPSWADQQ